MGLLKVDHFCCCWTVRTGTLIFGNITWFGNALNLIALLYVYDPVVQYPKNQGVSLLLIGQMVSCSIAIALSGFLVLGVLYKKPNLMLPYIVALAIGVVILGFGTAIAPIVIGTLTGLVALSFGVFFTFILSLLASIHCWLVVYTQYSELKSHNGPDTVRLTMNEEVCEA